MYNVYRHATRGAFSIRRNFSKQILKKSFQLATSIESDKDVLLFVAEMDKKISQQHKRKKLFSPHVTEFLAETLVDTLPVLGLGWPGSSKTNNRSELNTFIWFLILFARISGRIKH